MLTYAEASRAGDRRGDAARRHRVGGRRGPRPRRRVRPVQGPRRGVRAGAHRRRADLGGLHHGRRRRRRHDGHAADRRAQLLRLRALRHRRARQPGRQGPLHVRRPGPRAARGARADRHVALLRRPALAIARGLVHAHPWPRGGRPATPADNKGLLKAAIRCDDPVVYLEHKNLWALEGEVPDGDHLVEIGKARVARAGKDITIVSWSAHGARLPRRGGDASRRSASTPRSSTCAACGRGTRRRCWRAWRRPAACSSCTRRCGSAASAPRSRRQSPSARTGTEGAGEAARRAARADQLCAEPGGPGARDRGADRSGADAVARMVLSSREFASSEASGRGAAYVAPGSTGSGLTPGRDDRRTEMTWRSPTR